MGEKTDPASAAMAWIERLKADDVEVAWGGLTRDFRTAILQLELCELNWNEPPDDTAAADELVADLVAQGPRHEDWDELRPDQYLEVIADAAKTEEMAPGSRLRPIAPGLELIRLMVLADLDRDQQGNAFLAPEKSARTVSLFMEESQTEGWLVAGIGETILHPGWPPVHQRMVGPDD